MLPLLALNKLRPTGYNIQIQRIFVFVKSRLNLKISKDLEKPSSLEPCLEHYWPDPWHYFVGNKAKGRISKRVFQENKARQIFQKTNISYPLICTRGKKCSFFGKFGVLCFLETTVLRFSLLSDYRRFFPRKKNLHGVTEQTRTLKHAHTYMHTYTNTKAV